MKSWFLGFHQTDLQTHPFKQHAKQIGFFCFVLKRKIKLKKKKHPTVWISWNDFKILKINNGDQEFGASRSK